MLKKRNGTALAKFVICSLVGILFFFVNVPYNGKTTVPLLHAIDIAKSLVPQVANMWLVVILCATTLGTCLWAKMSSAPKWIKERHSKDSVFSYFCYIASTVFAFMVALNIGPAFIIDPTVGMSSLNVARDVFYSLTVAGTLVALLTEFGLLEFLGILMEPIMRKVFRVPGKASIDALSSFVCAPSLGVMITSNLYKNKVYTARESIAITTSFSICSLGTYAFLSGLTGAAAYYSQIVLSSLIVTFIMAIIMVRIPPLSKKKDTYIDGEVQTEEQRKTKGYSSDTFPSAIDAASEKVEGVSFSVIIKAMLNSVGFAWKVCTYIISISVIFLALAKYTPIVGWLGVPIAPILELFGLADAQTIAPGILAGFFALSLPSSLVAGAEIAASSGFFVVLLSTSQIIFFTESANTMLDSAIPVGFKDLLLIFLVRTAFLIPICAIATHIVF